MAVQDQKRPRLSPLEKAAQLRAAADKLEAQAQQQLRKEDTRRKIILGGAVLAEARENPTFAKQFAEIVSRRVSKANDLKAVEGWQA
jgi:hypothetical protein